MVKTEDGGDSGDPERGVECGGGGDDPRLLQRPRMRHQGVGEEVVGSNVCLGIGSLKIGRAKTKIGQGCILLQIPFPSLPLNRIWCKNIYR